MARNKQKSEGLSERGYRLSLALEARLVAHCAAWGEPAADVVADAVEAMLDELGDVIEEGPEQSDGLVYERDAEAQPDLFEAAS